VPPENLAALRKAAEQIRIPVATGERIHTRHEYRELFERQAADIIQPDITHIGGILETRKLAAWADAYYVLVAPHNVGGPVSTAANLHLAACTTNFKIQEHFNDFAEEFAATSSGNSPPSRTQCTGTPNLASSRRHRRLSNSRRPSRSSDGMTTTTAVPRV
jgi:galactonate dehydratase